MVLLEPIYNCIGNYLHYNYVYLKQNDNINISI